MRTVPRPFAVALAALAALACSGDPGSSSQPDAGQGAYGLALAGNAILTLHPGEARSLQLVLAQAEVGPIPGGAVHLEFADGDPAGAALDKADLTTGFDGTATVRLTAGRKSEFKIVATAPGFPAVRAVAFAVSVVEVHRLLQIVGTPQVQVGTDGISASVALYLSASVGLRARLLDADTGQPIPGEVLTFSIQPSFAKATFSGPDPRTGTVATGAAGDGQVFLVSSATTEKLLVTAQAQAGGGGAVTFAITVEDDATGASCASSQQCPAGQQCVSGVCSDPGSGGSQCTAGSDHPCPFGYECQNGVCLPPTNPSCDPDNPSCPSTQSCQCSGAPGAQTCQCVDLCPACSPGTHCQVNGTAGTCVPDGSGTPDLSGVWYTRHTYSIAQALPAFVAQMTKVVRVIDQLINGQFFSGALSWLNAIVKAIIDQYVPAWVTTVVSILDDLGTFLSNLRSQGSMRLAHGADATHYRGTEVWQSFVFYFLPLCNGNIGGDPAIPPDCARFDVATSDSTLAGGVAQCQGQSVPAISVQVAPFTAAVAGAGSPQAAPWTVSVDQRQVQVKLGKVILAAINLLISSLTEYQCIDEALDCQPGNSCLIDCQALGQTVSDATGGFVPAGIVTDLCYPAVTAAGQAITGLLAGISFDTDLLKFDGHASVGVDGDPSSCDSGNLCAGKLGQDDYDYRLQKDPGHRDGLWSGSFFSLIQGMPGAWEATRDPPAQ